MPLAAATSKDFANNRLDSIAKSLLDVVVKRFGCYENGFSTILLADRKRLSFRPRRIVVCFVVFHSLAF